MTARGHAGLVARILAWSRGPVDEYPASRSVGVQRATSPAYAELQALATAAATGSIHDVATSPVSQASTARSTLASIGARLAGARQAAAAGVADVNQLAAGARAVSTGAAALHDGLGRALGGATALQSGAERVAAGATSLAPGLDAAVAAVPSLDPAQRAHATSVLERPVRLQQTNLHPAGVYGRRLVPFFFAVARLVFGLGLDPLHPMTPRGGALRIMSSSGYGPYPLRDVLALAGVGLLALGGTTLLAMRHQGWTMARLSPPSSSERPSPAGTLTVGVASRRHSSRPRRAAGRGPTVTAQGATLPSLARKPQGAGRGARARGSQGARRGESNTCSACWRD